MQPESEQDRIRDLLKENPKGLTIEEVSRKLSLNRATAAKYLNSMMIAGQAELRELGRAKVFYLSQRLPLANLLSLSSDLILILDRDLFIQEVNDSVLSCFGVAKEDLKGRTIGHSALAPHFTGEFMAVFQQVLAGSEVLQEVRFTIGGQDRYFRMKLIPMVFESGEHAAGMILEDISAMKRYQMELEERIRERTATLQKEVELHKRTETALRENDAVLQSMFNATPVGVGLLVERVIRKVNLSFCEMTGYSAKELTGQNTRILYTTDEEYRRVWECLYQPTSNDAAGMVESQIRRKDGTNIDVMISLSPFDPKNLSSGVTVTIMDITGQKRTADALKRAGREVALLTSVTRHDILNKLTALRGYIRYMKRLDISENLVELVKREENLAEQIARLINFTRDYKNVGVQPPGWIHVGRTIAALQKTSDTAGVSLRADTGTLEIFADPLITRVFSNLIENSLRHGGSITAISIKAQERAGRMVIVYEDNGRGIPETEKETIFEWEAGTKTGLGLFLTRKILAITGIAIAETGTPGNGARFEITVPEGSFRFTEE